MTCAFSSRIREQSPPGEAGSPQRPGLQPELEWGLYNAELVFRGCELMAWVTPEPLWGRHGR